jgi:hypothetical protein
VDKQTIKSQIKALVGVEYDEDQRCQRIHNEVKSILAQFEGKPISKRIATAVSKAHIVRLEKSEDSRGFEYFDICHGSAAAERNEHRKAFLANEPLIDKIADAAERLQVAKAELEAMIGYPNPDQFGIERIVGLRKPDGQR